MVMTVTSEPGYNSYGAPADHKPTTTGLVTFVVGGAVTLGLWVWNRWVRGGRTGQSWGKKALGITLQKDGTGEPLGVWMAFVRDVAHDVDGLVLYLGHPVAAVGHPAADVLGQADQVGRRPLTYLARVYSARTTPSPALPNMQ